eukprot:2844637-Heterocapsa_arctica.AAC.1
MAGAGEVIARRSAEKTTPVEAPGLGPERLAQPGLGPERPAQPEEMAHAERVEPQQPEALLDGQAPRRYAAAEEKLRGGLATD